MALMDIHKHLVAEVADLAEIVQQPLVLLVVLAVMADFLLVAVEAGETLTSLLVALAAEAATV
jgi:hypothetical protein